jgi:hypothetical protein
MSKGKWYAEEFKIDCRSDVKVSVTQASLKSGHSAVD